MEYEKLIAKKNYSRVFYLLKDANLSERYISKLRQKDMLFLNGKPCDMRTQVNENDIIEFALNIGKKTDIAECDMKLDILFEDKDFLIANKPPLVASTPTKSHYNFNLAGAVCKYMKKEDPNFVYRILNRLDKDTSGIVIVAKNLFAYNSVKNIEKRYEAICEGNIKENFDINQPILTITKDGINERKRIVSPLGKKASTHVEVIKNYSNFCHISLRIEQGRTHQIRVHMSNANHSLIGDEIYGKKSNLINHTALICKEVSFIHPRTKKEIRLIDDYDKDFKNLLDQIAI